VANTNNTSNGRPSVPVGGGGEGLGAGGQQEKLREAVDKVTMENRRLKEENNAMVQKEALLAASNLRLEREVGKVTRQCAKLLEDKGGGSGDATRVAVADIRRENEKMLLVQRLREQIAGLEVEVSDRDKALVALRRASGHTGLMEVTVERDELQKECQRVAVAATQTERKLKTEVADLREQVHLLAVGRRQAAPHAAGGGTASAAGTAAGGTGADGGVGEGGGEGEGASPGLAAAVREVGALRHQLRSMAEQHASQALALSHALEVADKAQQQQAAAAAAHAKEKAADREKAAALRKGGARSGSGGGGRGDARASLASVRSSMNEFGGGGGQSVTSGLSGNATPLFDDHARKGGLKKKNKKYAQPNDGGGDFEDHDHTAGAAGSGGGYDENVNFLLFGDQTQEQQQQQQQQQGDGAMLGAATGGQQGLGRSGGGGGKKSSSSNNTGGGGSSVVVGRSEAEQILKEGEGVGEGGDYERAAAEKAAR
jgi:hypothetical protein